MEEPLQADLLFTTDTEKTFQYEDTLPSLPVPDLHDTLQTYLKSVQPFVSEEAFRHTKELAEDFENGIGKELQKKLVERSQRMRNWLEKWWEDTVYLEPRYPTAPLVNGSGLGTAMYTESFKSRDGCQVEHGALVLHYFLKVWQMIRRETLRSDRNRKGEVFSMGQFRRHFSTIKIPGVQKDHLEFNFKTVSQGETPRNVIITHRGRLFNIDAIDENDNPLTPPEFEKQLQYIIEYCEKKPAAPGICILTAHNRTSWAQLRSRLIALSPKNWENLQLIHKSTMCLCLEDASPWNPTELVKETLFGDTRNIWFDKCISVLCFKNGSVSGNGDHAPYDAMLMLVTNTYVDMCLYETEAKWKGTTAIRDLKPPVELEFVVDDVILNGIEEATTIYQGFTSSLSCHHSRYNDYGKNYIREQKLHPDTHVQLAIQNAYYRRYKKPAPTYETATTRRYFNARTETLRSCTMESLELSKAMLDSTIPARVKYQMYRKAADEHNKLMEEATFNRGCDRHLLGLSLTAKEEGLPLHDLYTDESFTASGGGGNFVLSTSFLGYGQNSGAVVPMVENGYGIFYSIAQESMDICMVNWTTSGETDSEEFMKIVYESLDELKRMLDQIGTSEAAKL